MHCLCLNRWPCCTVCLELPHSLLSEVPTGDVRALLNCHPPSPRQNGTFSKDSTLLFPLFILLYSIISLWVSHVPGPLISPHNRVMSTCPAVSSGKILCISECPRTKGAKKLCGMWIFDPSFLAPDTCSKQFYLFYLTTLKWSVITGWWGCGWHCSLCIWLQHIFFAIINVTQY